MTVLTRSRNMLYQIEVKSFSLPDIVIFQPDEKLSRSTHPSQQQRMISKSSSWDDTVQTESIRFVHAYKSKTDLSRCPWSFSRSPLFWNSSHHERIYNAPFLSCQYHLTFCQYHLSFLTYKWPNSLGRELDPQSGIHLPIGHDQWTEKETSPLKPLTSRRADRLD